MARMWSCLIKKPLKESEERLLGECASPRAARGVQRAAQHEYRVRDGVHCGAPRRRTRVAMAVSIKLRQFRADVVFAVLWTQGQPRCF